MFCPNCGKKINDNLKFCTHCGAKLNEVHKQSSENQQSDDKDNIKFIIISSIVVCISIILITVGFLLIETAKPQEQQAVQSKHEKQHEYAITENKPINYPKCDDIYQILKPMKSERTEELQSVLENSDYVLNDDYSLWYKNTENHSEGKCTSNEIIKNLFQDNPNIYLTHPITYNVYYADNEAYYKQEGYSTFENLIAESELYDGERHLSQSEINNLLEESLPENIIKKADSVISASKTQEDTKRYESSDSDNNDTIDISEVDFGPYMKELQRKIKKNWNPPKGNESKRVVLLFSLNKAGELLNVEVKESSGSEKYDKAAIKAVELTAPFKPLPVEFKEDSVDIQFTLDYNVFGGRVR